MVKKYTLFDFLMAECVAAIGAAEVAHLAGCFLGWSFVRCTYLFAALAVVVLAGGVIIAYLGRRRLFESNKRYGLTATTGFLYLLFAVIVLSQVLFLLFGNGVYRQGDMTVETVGSFLEQDGMYLVNPLTGRSYEGGIPLRLKILCLPTVYGSICSLSGLEAAFVVQRIVPVMVLAMSYLAFGTLGRSLFERDATKQAMFLVLVAMLFWIGAYNPGVDGFGVLCSGYRGVTLRNVVLVPWCFSLCIRKRWFGTVLCILGEACIVWTLYGMGICLLVTAGMFAVQFFCKRAESLGREEA